MLKPRRNNRLQHSESSSESQSQSNNNIMAALSPATKNLLANMNRSRVTTTTAASSTTNNNNNTFIDDVNDSSSSLSKFNNQEERGRMPLSSIQENINATNKTTATATATTTTTNKQQQRQQQSHSSSSTHQQHHRQRIMGPHELNYTQNYQAYITQVIHNYETKIQTNLHGKQQQRHPRPTVAAQQVKRKSYKMMNLQERNEEMKRVDELLERLILERDSKKSGGSGGVSGGRRWAWMEEDNEDDEETYTNNNYDDVDQSFGSATTMGGDHDTTTNNNNSRHHNTMNKSISSETTMMEQSMSLLGTSSTTTTSSHNNTTIHTTADGSSSNTTIMDGSTTTTMEQSMSLLGHDDDNDDGNNDDDNRGRKSLESETTACEQSMSLLGNESHLYSPSGCNGGGGGMQQQEDDSEDDDDESRFSRGRNNNNNNMAPPPPPIEKVRRYHQPNDASNDNNDDRMMTSPPYTSSYNHKRCASNSGKRGLKSRFRYETNGGGGEFTADDSLLQHFHHDSNDIGNDGMLFPSQEDDFSPIQHRYSHEPCHDDDGLGLDFRTGGYDDDNDNGIEDGDGQMFSTQQDGGGGDDDVSFGCNNGGFDNDNDDYVGGDYGNNNWTQSSGLLTQQQQQQSQWSTFKTVDPSTQTNEEDSPVKRRAIRFESTQKGYSRYHQGREDENEKIQSMRDELADMAVQDHHQGAVDQDGDDPIQTVGNLCRRARSCNETGMEDLDEVAPMDVRLRDGQIFHKDPLQCRQVQKKKSSSKAKSKGSKKTVRIANGGYAASDSEESLSDQEEPSFKDPTSAFPSRVAERLNGAFEFMVKSDDQSTLTTAHPDVCCSEDNAGLLLSLNLKQTMAVTSKLLLTSKKLARLHRNSRNSKTASTPSTVNAQPARGGDYLAGGTLIILREKEEIPTWEAYLREYTSLSVFSHNSLQGKDRKAATAAPRSAAYDVVLTTYDLLKSKDATIPLDSIGKAILNSDSKKDADDGGWLKTRGSETQSGGEAKLTCLPLSVLHRMSWYRVIMMDSLGRKGYLTKPKSTQRGDAAKAINSLSRFVIFVKEEDDAKMENKFKNDRNQIKAVVQALHLPSGTTAKKFFESWVHDVKCNIKESESSLDSSSCDGSMSDEYLSG